MSLDPKPLAVIFGCASTELTAQEKAFFTACNPLGFILFQRNCETPEQVRRLVGDLRACVGRENAPVLIDQEGGRVARLKPPHWPEFPPAKTYGDVFARDEKAGEEAAGLGGRLIAHELNELGISVNCAPVLDVAHTGANPIIGDRAFGTDVGVVTRLAQAFMRGLMAGGVTAVVKHTPGHGRALVDSHKELPRVEASEEDLRATDFVPFKAMHMAPWAMSAHVTYTALDADNPATLSAGVIEDTIRRYIGFRGILISDDLSMQALRGGLAQRARACLQAGCDLALHCNGEMEEMKQVVEGAFPMTRASWARYKLGDFQCAAATRLDFNVRESRLRFNQLLDI